MDDFYDTENDTFSVDAGAVIPPAFTSPDHFLFYVLAAIVGAMAFETFKQSFVIEDNWNMNMKSMLFAVLIFGAGWYVCSKWPRDN